MNKGLILALTILITIASSVWSQEVTGNLEGRVLELEGEPIAAANIIVEGSHLQGIRSTTTDEKGYFRVFALPVGSCAVKIQHPAFQEILFQNVTIFLGKTTTLGEIRLKLKVLEEHEVVVIGERPLIDPITTTAGMNLQASTYEVLPTERNFRSIISVLPQANTSFLGDETNVAGSTGLENCYFIDGVHATDPYWGKTSTNLPYNFVKEIEVKEGGYEAEYGRALGGIVNVITYSGGNKFQGNVFGFFTHSQLASKPRLGFLDAEVDAFSTYDVGFSLGGPVVRDKLWFFAAYNKGFENQDIELPGFGFHPDKKIMHMFAGKLTWQAAEHTNVVFSVFGDPTTHHRIGGYQPLPYGVPSSLENSDPFKGFYEEGGINLSLQARSFIGRTLLLEAFIARYTRDEIQKGDTEIGRTEPFFIDLATKTWSGGLGGQDRLRIVRTSAKLSATLFLGNHLLKAGIDYEDNRTKSFSETTSPGFIEKWGANEYFVLFWLVDTEVHNRIPSLFLQDSWQVTKRMRLNMGLRWDGQYFIGSDGKTAQSITNQFQPRVGFSFQPGELGTQKIFGSYGRFYQQLPLYFPDLSYAPYEEYMEIYTEDPRDPAAVPIDHTIVISPDAPYFPEVENLEGEHFDEFTAGYERIFADHFKLGIRGIYRTLRQVVGFGFKDGFLTGNPGRGDLSFLPKPKRNYTALEVTIERFGGARLNFQASYVLSRNYGNYAGLYSSDQRSVNPNNYFSLQLEEQAQNSTGLLPNDRTHVFKLFGSCRIGPRLTFGTFFTWQTGTPLNEFGATWLVYRPIFLVKRGSAGRTPAVWDLNLRLTYNLDGFWSSKFKSRIILDVLHVGSPRKAVDIDQIRFQTVDSEGNQIAPNINYGNAMRYQPPMTMRLGIEFGF